MKRIVPDAPVEDFPRMLAGDREMLDAAWDALGLGVTSWWRLWKTALP